MVKEISEKISKKENDYQIFLFLRSMQKKNPFKLLEKKYEINMTAKVDHLFQTIKNNTKGSKIESILDIGTEKIDFLDQLESSFDAKVNGINVGDGFCHYEEVFESYSSDPRFQLYDGEKIPFLDCSFDLVTLYSVIHHVASSKLDSFVREICRVSKRFVFIKDVNLVDDCCSNLFALQHELFEGAALPGRNSFRNMNVTLQGTKDLFSKHGFQVVHTYQMNNFNKSYYMLLERK